MRILAGLVAASLLAAGPVYADQGRGRGQGQAQDKGRGDDRGASSTAPNRPASVVVFSPREITLVRTHFGNKYKNLPPGLQKKLARGGSLPPGWQKKIEGFPSSLERQLPVLGSGHKYGVYDGHAVIYDPLTHAILDIVSLF